MRSRSFVLLLTFMLVLAACAPIPVAPEPTAVAPTTAAPTEAVAFTATPPPPDAATPVATEAVTPTVSAPVTATVVITDVSPVLPTPTLAITTAVTDAVAAPSWVAATYRDEVGGWEIDYPDGWYLTDVSADIKQQSLGYSITLTSWQPQEPGTQGIPEGGSKLDISVTKDGAASADAAVEARRAEISEGDAGSKIAFEEPWDLPGGLSGVHWTIEPSSGEIIHEFVTTVNGNRVVASGFGDEALFEQIVSTRLPLTVVTNS